MATTAMKVAANKSSRAAIGLLRTAAQRYFDLYGIYPQWAYVSLEWMTTMTGNQEFNPQTTVGVVGGCVCYVNPKLDGLAVVMVNRRVQ